MKKLLIPLLFLFGCLHQDASTYYTEGGINAAGDVWLGRYNDRMDYCEDNFFPQSPEMEDCFGEYYDANHQVKETVQEIKALLSHYWIARAVGLDPSYVHTMTQIQAKIDALPDIARGPFENVKGYIQRELLRNRY